MLGFVWVIMAQIVAEFYQNAQGYVWDLWAFRWHISIRNGHISTKFYRNLSRLEHVMRPIYED